MTDPVLVHRRTRGVLVAGQVLSGLGMGSTLSAGALLATLVSGSEAFSGAATTGSTVGAALAAVPLAALAQRLGRSSALAAGALTAAAGAFLGIVAAVLVVFPLLVLAFAMIGVGTAVNLQSRFAATDLAPPARRGRDLSIVVWATTIGAVVGPNTIGLGNRLGLAAGLPELAGPFLLTIAAQALAAVIYLVGLRPDPLLLARRLEAAAPAAAVARVDADRTTARVGIAVIGLSHATMASVMAMTPVHLTHHGATLEIVGLTISLHVAGMYALSPLWGVLSDRLGRILVIGLGQAMLLAALLCTSIGAESEAAVVVGLILLGLGWSASTVSGSALVAGATSPEHRTRIQGRSDLVMSASGGLGGALAGVVLALLGYAGLSLTAIALVAVASALLLTRVRAGRVRSVGA
ncbi:MFS transporter [Homoserinibacter sp. YIM 151385]|uniref:MFS transporter n=1 Tax=Homoserinibacter sp. YIM 151385 TaxID=2985506 RepID=UPI0022F06138|nr:MFS transporter [Homoserinibacter sp. YIM 151385]WBU39268.1 MFS transporter [Homoserinibacter sp. YIM 151385]